PFPIPASAPHERTIGLLGNSNDVGMFLAAPAIAAAALAISSKKYRVIAIVIAVVLTCGLLASETLGAIAAICAGLFVLHFRARPAVAIAVTVSVVAAGAAFVRLSPPRWAKAQTKLAAAMRGDVDPLLSGRLPAFLAAWRMFREHPISGVGLGCFAFHYFEKKIEIETEHSFLMDRHAENFGEVHNEHLQILAEGGLPAYAIFLFALWVVASVSFQTPKAEGDKAHFVETLGAPLAVTVFVLALSSFPFRTAAATE